MTVVGGFRTSDSRYLSLSLELFNVRGIAHYGTGRILTASRPSRQKADAIIVEDSGIFGALDAVRAI